jgi:hypothetical protein
MKKWRIPPFGSGEYPPFLKNIMAYIQGLPYSDYKEWSPGCRHHSLRSDYAQEETEM